MDSAEYWTGGDTEVSVKEKAPTGAATSAGAAGVETGRETISSEYYSTVAADGQAGKIFSLLLEGEANCQRQLENVGFRRKGMSLFAGQYTRVYSP